MGRLTLILGGARSGKSTFAQQLAGERSRRVAYIATARVLDEEMEQRIAAHQLARPDQWVTLEIPSGIGRTLAMSPLQADGVVMDCLTMLVTNLLMDIPSNEEKLAEAEADAKVQAEVDELLDIIREGSADWIVVSNEVGLGLVPPYPLGRVYRDLLGRANQRLAACAEEVFFLVAGIPVPIHAFRKQPLSEPI
jgi:adenosylcobinamide kinase / adenosylcobinamide-phosphate guanylyltransferase